jgi:hypothetical protein
MHRTAANALAAGCRRRRRRLSSLRNGTVGIERLTQRKHLREQQA